MDGKLPVHVHVAQFLANALFAVGALTAIPCTVQTVTGCNQPSVYTGGTDVQSAEGLLGRKLMELVYHILIPLSYERLYNARVLLANRLYH